MKKGLSSTFKRFMGIFLSLSILPLFGCANFYNWANDPSQPKENMEGYRSFTQKIKDESVTNDFFRKMNSDAPELLDLDIKAHTFNDVLLITGTVESVTQQSQIKELLSKLDKQVRVFNEIEIGPKVEKGGFNTTDEWISARLKARMLFTEGFPASRLKVITHNRTVYMMGALTNQETEMAILMARQVKGITKIVKLIDTLDAIENTKSKQATQSIKSKER